MLLEDVDYFVRFIELPPSVGGCVTPNNDGTFSVYLNSRKSPETQMQSLRHEIDHILNDDLFGDKDVLEIEKKRRDPVTPS